MGLCSTKFFHLQVLLVHQGSKGSFSRVFDFEANDLNGEDGGSRTSPFESRFPINSGITGYVATTAEVSMLQLTASDLSYHPFHNLRLLTSQMPTKILVSIKA